jgi:hypothetical protein
MIPKSLIFIFLSMPYSLFAELGLIVVPVADLISAPAKHFNPKLDAASFYEQIPLSPVNPGKNLPAGPRLHQALFNELVEIVENSGQEVKIKILNAYFLNTITKQKTSAFWTLKSNLVPLDKIKTPQYLPDPIDYHKNSHILSSHTATLIAPWHHFSAGTRFRLNPKDGKAYLYQADTNQFIKIRIPSRFLIFNTPRSSSQLRRDVVKLVQNWATPQHHKSIPYAWGGCSFVDRLAMHKVRMINQNGLHYYTVAGKKLNTHTGLDCSGLVLRACQAVGIPYFYKNSSTLAHELPALKPNEPILPGDLIWLPGHVIMITDPAKGLCVEARDYGQGYGKVQQIHISKLFQETTNFAQIKAAHHTGTPLSRIDRNGALRGKYKIKVLKLI